jgi:Protein of unknown function (DUF2550)
VGERLALDAIWLLAAFLLLVVLAAAALAARRYLLERGGGTVECGLRRPAARGAWRLGVAAYQGDDFCWFGALGVRFRPEQVFHRRSLKVLSRRPSLPSEATVLGAERIVIELWTGPPADSPDVSAAPAPGPGEAAEDRVELAMTVEALTGFLSWLEASPPGSHLEDIALVHSERTRVFAVGCSDPSGRAPRGRASTPRRPRFP